jgi:hypothetical protein
VWSVALRFVTVHDSVSCVLGKDVDAVVIVHWPAAFVVHPLGVAAEVGLQVPVTATSATGASFASLTVTVTLPPQVVAPDVAPVTREPTWSLPVIVKLALVAEVSPGEVADSV